MVETGDVAPGFALEGAVDDEIGTFTLEEALEDGPAVLSFYVYDYSPVCTDQLCELDEMEFLTFDEHTTVYGISTDGPYSHREFARDNDLSYALLTDGERTVYEQYDLVDTTEDGDREPVRGIVVVDADGVVRYRWTADENWNEWTIQPLSEAASVVEDLVGR